VPTLLTVQNIDDFGDAHHKNTGFYVSLEKQLLLVFLKISVLKQVL
jgi:hypothetical protein